MPAEWCASWLPRHGVGGEKEDGQMSTPIPTLTIGKHTLLKPSFGTLNFLASIICPTFGGQL